MSGLTSVGVAVFGVCALAFMVVGLVELWRTADDSVSRGMAALMTAMFFGMLAIVLGAL